MDISAIIVTRGDVDLELVVDSLDHFDDIVIWNNLAITEAKHDLIYVQDDDCLVHNPGMLTADHSRHLLVANTPRDRIGDRITLVGWGALFHRSLPTLAFRRYLAHYPMDALFLRTCDVVFGALTPNVRPTLPFDHLPWAVARNRMYRQPDHYGERDVIFSRADRLSRGVHVAS
jgi:hypothetical protein